ncbi:MAG: gamma-mobile-trio protein GmtX [Burkholderiales bacterium]
MTESTVVHPDVVLQELLKRGNRSDKEAKLRKLNELCSTEYNRHNKGARDLSVANISRVAESHGLFKARTIYNKQSQDYAALIKAWEAYNGPKDSKRAKDRAASSDKLSFLLTIEDAAVRSLCQIAFSERDKLRAELNMLKSRTEVVVDMRPLGAGVAEGKSSVAVVELAARLTDSERKSLVAAIDVNTLAKRKWRLGKSGEVLDERDRFIFNPGFATGISKILGQSITPMLNSKRSRS